MKPRPASYSAKDFFYYAAISSIVDIATAQYSGKTIVEILNDLFLRYTSGIIIGMFTGIGIMAGKDFYIFLKQRRKK